ncbi:hypothetical protein PUN28_013538 [Cardiocondyla obscurior]|uniref:Uncharacterized protein n=1 Tax=Cardiocondyla obscurior TaxID=286306 RepID=A0AAW2F4C3_9HYME
MAYYTKKSVIKFYMPSALFKFYLYKREKKKRKDKNRSSLCVSVLRYFCNNIFIPYSIIYIASYIHIINFYSYASVMCSIGLRGTSLLYIYIILIYYVFIWAIREIGDVLGVFVLFIYCFFILFVFFKFARECRIAFQFGMLKSVNLRRVSIPLEYISIR